MSWLSRDLRRSCGHLAGIVRLSKQTWLHDWRRYAMLLCLRSGGPDCSYEMRWFDAMLPVRSVTKDVSLHLRRPVDWIETDASCQDLDFYVGRVGHHLCHYSRLGGGQQTEMLAYLLYESQGCLGCWLGRS